MKEEYIFKYSHKRLLIKFIDYILGYIYLIIFGIITYIISKSLLPLIFGFVILLPILMLSHILLVNYYKFSRNGSVIINKKGIKYSFNNKTILMHKENIKSIELYQSHYKEKKLNYSFVPWSGGTHYYYKIEVQNYNYVIIPCILDDSNKTIEKKLERYCMINKINRIYPYIKL